MSLHKTCAYLDSKDKYSAFSLVCCLPVNQRLRSVFIYQPNQQTMLKEIPFSRLPSLEIPKYLDMSHPNFPRYFRFIIFDSEGQTKSWWERLPKSITPEFINAIERRQQRQQPAKAIAKSYLTLQSIDMKLGIKMNLISLTIAGSFGGFLLLILPTQFQWVVWTFEAFLLLNYSWICGRESALDYFLGNYEHYLSPEEEDE